MTDFGKKIINFTLDEFLKIKLTVDLLEIFDLD